jgi:hypothetical protein
MLNHGLLTLLAMVACVLSIVLMGDQIACYSLLPATRDPAWRHAQVDHSCASRACRQGTCKIDDRVSVSGVAAGQ